MYIAYSNQRDFHIYFDNLVDEICEERFPGWKNMKNDPRPEKEWLKAPYLPESTWQWDNAANISWLHFSEFHELHILFCANDKNSLKLEICGHDEQLDLTYENLGRWQLSDELMFSNVFIKDIIRAYCSTNKKDEIIAKFNTIIGNANKYKPNTEIINQFKHR